MLLVAFCEAPADFTITTDLVDRVLRAHGPNWVADNISDAPEAVRTWHGDGKGRAFFDLHRVGDYARDLQVRVPHGRFNGRRAPGDLMALTIFSIVRKLTQTGCPVEAVVLVWDMDKQPAGRERALYQARAEATWASFKIVLGRPNAKREAWVLAGFDPADDDEIERLRDVRQELGFAPNEHSERLDATDDLARRSAKRVHGLLIGKDHDRERRCWMETDLDVLGRRGAGNGLCDFLGEVKDWIVPLLLRRSDG